MRRLENDPRSDHHLGLSDLVRPKYKPVTNLKVARNPEQGSLNFCCNSGFCLARSEQKLKDGT